MRSSGPTQARLRTSNESVRTAVLLAGIVLVVLSLLLAELMT